MEEKSRRNNKTYQNYSRYNFYFKLIFFLEIAKAYLSNYHAVDTFDQSVMQFRPLHRSKRWYISVFWSLLQFAIHNSWIMYKQLQLKANVSESKIMGQKDFIKV